MYCWSLAWKILSINTSMWGECNCAVQYSLALPFFGIGMKPDLFQSCGHWWVNQMCWHIECSPFTASSFRIWNSSAGISSLPLVLLIVMLLKAHLTSHSSISWWKWKVKVKSLSHVQPSATQWTAAHQASPSMGVSRQEYWSGVPLPSSKLLHNCTHLTSQASAIHEPWTSWCSSWF